MRAASRLGVPVMLLVLGGNVQAQVGLAARLESGSPLSLGVPILMGGRLMVEPVLTLHRTSVRTDQDSVSGSAGPSIDQVNRTTTLHLGVGAYLRRRGPVTVFAGPRIGWATASQRFEARISGTPGGAFLQEGSLSGLWFGALVGVEAAVGARFTVGAEAHWFSSTLEGDVEETSSFGGPTTTGTRRRRDEVSDLQLAGVIRWYPGRPPR